MGTMTQVQILATFESWQAAARHLLRDGVPPAEVTWVESAAAETATAAPSVARVPRKFVDLARQAAGARGCCSLGGALRDALAHRSRTARPAGADAGSAGPAPQRARRRGAPRGPGGRGAGGPEARGRRRRRRLVRATRRGSGRASGVGSA